VPSEQPEITKEYIPNLKNIDQIVQMVSVIRSQIEADVAFAMRRWFEWI
jgi:hypothetical protein